MMIKSKGSAAAITAAVSLCMIFSGCSAKESYGRREIFAMDTRITAEAWGEGAETAAEAAVSEIKRLEGIFSVTSSDSDIGRINSAGGGKTPVSGDTADIIRFGKALGERTGGALDITVYPLVREWGFTTGDYHIPPRERITELLSRVGCGEIAAAGDSVTVPEGYMLDLGALGKGYACDRAADIMEKAGISRGIINAGGNIRVIGEKPDGEPWRIAVADPFSAEDTLCVIGITGGAAATSGNYQRYFIGEDGERYCHIIDPASGYPADSGLAAVTVTADSGLLCDGLSTALFVMGREKAEALWRESGDFEMLLVSSGGEIYITEGMAEKTDITRERVTVIKR